MKEHFNKSFISMTKLTELLSEKTVAGIKLDLMFFSKFHMCRSKMPLRSSSGSDLHEILLINSNYSTIKSRRRLTSSYSVKSSRVYNIKKFNWLNKSALGTAQTPNEKRSIGLNSESRCYFRTKRAVLINTRQLHSSSLNQSSLSDLIKNLTDINNDFLSHQYPETVSKYHISNKAISQKVNLLILNLKAIQRGAPYAIRIGLKGKSPSLLTALVGDPLSGDQEWYTLIKDRDMNENNLVTYNYDSVINNLPNEKKYKKSENVSYNRTLTVWQIVTPILNSDVRMQNFKNLYKAYNKDEEEVDIISSTNLKPSSLSDARRLNNLEFLEINQKITGNCSIIPLVNQSIEEEDFLYETFNPFSEFDEEDLTMDIGDGCHFYIYHGNSDLEYPTNEVFPYMMVIDGEINNKVDELKMNTIIVNKEKVKFGVNSSIAQEANEILMSNFGETSKYIDMLKQSNFLKFIYMLNMTTSNNDNIKNLLKVINRLISVKFFSDVGANEGIEMDKLDKLKRSIDLEIQDWAKTANLFLQKKFSADLDNYEKSFLSWYKLIYINDDLEYYLITMVNRALRENGDPVCFMDKINYVEGKIDSHMLQESVKNTRLVSNESFTNKLAPDIMQMQNQVTKLLTTNIYGIQTPAVIISLFGGHFLYGLDLYTVGGIICLSTALVCNNISKTWYKMIKEFKKLSIETLRNEINEEENYFRNKWENVIKSRQDERKKHLTLIKEFRDNIKAFEKEY